MSESASVYGCKDQGHKDEVPPGWCDANNVHIFLYVNQGPGEPNHSHHSNCPLNLPTTSDASCKETAQTNVGETP